MQTDTPPTHTHTSREWEASPGLQCWEAPGDRLVLFEAGTGSLLTHRWGVDGRSRERTPAGSQPSGAPFTALFVRGHSPASASRRRGDPRPVRALLCLGFMLYKSGMVLRACPRGCWVRSFVFSAGMRGGPWKTWTWFCQSCREWRAAEQTARRGLSAAAPESEPSVFSLLAGSGGGTSGRRRGVSNRHEA